MKHLSEDQLVLHHYGEAPPRETREIESHLAACAECGAALARLESVLRQVDPEIPERPADWEEQLWNRLRWRLRREEKRPAPVWRWIAAAAVLAIAFFAGTILSRRPVEPGGPSVTPAVARDIPPQARARVFVAVVADHLDHTEVALLEVVNAAEGADVGEAQSQVRDLVAANRIYRQTAESSGDAAVADILDDLEPILLEIAHGPSELSESQLASLRRRVEEKGILFKVRVVSTQMRERQEETLRKDQKSL